MTEISILVYCKFAWVRVLTSPQHHLGFIEPGIRINPIFELNYLGPYWDAGTERVKEGAKDVWGSGPLVFRGIASGRIIAVCSHSTDSFYLMLLAN